MSQMIFMPRSFFFRKYLDIDTTFFKNLSNVICTDIFRLKWISWLKFVKKFTRLVDSNYLHLTQKQIPKKRRFKAKGRISLFTEGLASNSQPVEPFIYEIISIWNFHAEIQFPGVNWIIEWRALKGFPRGDPRSLWKATFSSLLFLICTER